VILEKDVAQGILGTGHSSILQVPGTDEWYIAYHRFGMPGGDGTHRETTIDRLRFNEDGTIAKVVPTLGSIDPLEFGPDPAPAATTLPTIAGRPAVGSTLAASNGIWDQDGLTFAHQWLRDGLPIAGATSTHYRPGAADVGRRISVQVTATRDGVAPGVARSASTRPVSKAAAVLSAKLKDSTPKVGRKTKLTVTVSAQPSTVPATGKVKIKVDGKVVKTAQLVRGKAVAKLVFRKPGEHKLVIRYTGSPTVNAAKVVRTVRAHR
jgi:hypothetical protein